MCTTVGLPQFVLIVVVLVISSSIRSAIDVLIDFLGGHNPAADRVALELDHGQLTTTAVSRFELLAGVRSNRQDRLIRDLLAALFTLPRARSG